MPRRVPTFGLVIAILIAAAAVYLSTQLESPLYKFGVLFVAFFFIASAFMGLSYEGKITKQIIEAGYIDRYVSKHGVGNKRTFKDLIKELKRNGYKINPGVEKQLWEEIKKKTGHKTYQNSV